MQIFSVINIIVWSLFWIVCYDSCRSDLLSTGSVFRCDGTVVLGASSGDQKKERKHVSWIWSFNHFAQTVKNASGGKSPKMEFSCLARSWSASCQVQPGSTPRLKSEIIQGKNEEKLPNLSLAGPRSTPRLRGIREGGGMAASRRRRHQRHQIQIQKKSTKIQTHWQQQEKGPRHQPTKSNFASALKSWGSKYCAQQLKRGCCEYFLGCLTKGVLMLMDK